MMGPLSQPGCHTTVRRALIRIIRHPAFLTSADASWLIDCVGHLLAGTIKDTVTRFAHQKGHHVVRRFGWDCHGLPVEFEIDQELGIKDRDQVRLNWSGWRRGHTQEWGRRSRVKYELTCSRSFVLSTTFRFLPWELPNTISTAVRLSRVILKSGSARSRGSGAG